MAIRIEEARRIVETLYADVRPYDLSYEGRDSLPVHDESLRYGEIQPAALAGLFGDLSTAARGTFCDLGSGTGKAVFLAALLADFERLIGIELLEPLHTAARLALERYDRDFRPTLPRRQQEQIIEFQQADLHVFDPPEMDVVYIHATSFQPDLMKHSNRWLERLRPGGFAIIVTRPIDSPGLARLLTRQAEMDWGSTPVHLYERIVDPPRGR